MSHEPIPFNRPSLTGNELRYIAECLDSGHLAGDGPFARRCEALLEAALQVRKAFLTPACTQALEMCALVLDIQPGDEVIVPAFTYVSTVNAFVLCGARPVFVDIRPDTLNLDETQLESRITHQTKAVIAVHYGGVGCEMVAILETVARRGLALVEDNAHGLFGRYKGDYLGTFGCLAAQSFHETKNFTCGEGGAVLINDARHVERAEIIREKGTDRSRFLRGEVDKYEWVDRGSSYMPSDILGAFLYAQLEARERIQARRRQLWDSYYAGLQAWARSCGARLPTVPASCEQAYHMFYLLLPTPLQRQNLTAHLRERGVHAVAHYPPLHLSPMGRRCGGRPGDCPVTEEVSECLLRLPFYNDLTDTDQERVIAAVTSFNEHG